MSTHVHDLTIDRYGGGDGQDVIASCSCGWLDDECLSPTRVVTVVELAAFEILGLPSPQGSKTRMPNGAIIEGSSTTGRAKQKSWRAAVVETARDNADTEPYDGPLQLSAIFRMPMPASRRKSRRDAGIWPCTVKPDIDKLLRGLLDGLTAGGLIRDDARIFAIEAEQYEVVGWTGATVVLRQWEAAG